MKEEEGGENISSGQRRRGAQDERNLPTTTPSLSMAFGTRQMQVEPAKFMSCLR